jgi:hypothetical protein
MSTSLAITVPCLLTVRQVAVAFHVNKDRVRADCKAGRLRVNVRRMRGGRDGFWISADSAQLLYGAR